jgi:RNA polymerase sigma-70 factor (ECF subfamily)
MIVPRTDSRGVPDDVTLLQNVALGELDDLACLFDRYAKEIRRCIVRLGARGADIDDAVQTVFLELQRTAASFDPTRNARAWLMGIAAMVVRRQRRSLKQHVNRLLRFGLTHQDDCCAAVDRQVQASEELRLFADALRRLNPKKREVFTLVVLEELSGQEVAETLGIPINTVWTRLHYARSDLLRMLDGRQT